jgi:heat shock protein HspQ
MEAIGVNPKLQNPTAHLQLKGEEKRNVVTYVPEHQTVKQNSGMDHVNNVCVKTTPQRRM